MSWISVLAKKHEKTPRSTQKNQQPEEY